MCKKEFQPVADNFQISDRYMYPEDFNKFLYLTGVHQDKMFHFNLHS